MPNHPLTHLDERTDDVYVVYLDETGEFSHALRYVGRVAEHGAIPYERVSDLPSSVKWKIESLICQRPIYENNKSS